MGASFHLYYIDWEEFHQRFSVDLVEADKETETSDGIFTESFWGDNAYEQEEFYWRADIFFLEGIYEKLKAVRVFNPLSAKEKGWGSMLLQRLLASPDPIPKELSNTLIEGTAEFEFYRRWMEDFEFAFSRLIPFPFHKAGHYKDSDLDFFPLDKDLTINTVSPETVREMYARFPSSAIIRYSFFKALTDESPYYFACFLERFGEIVCKAVDKDKGFCSFVI